MITSRRMRALLIVCGLAVCTLAMAPTASAQPQPPELTKPVNDFTGRIDAASAQQLDSMIRALQQKTGDVVVIAVVDTVEPYDIADYAVKMFENHGRGIGQRGKENGVLMLVAINDRKARIEVGYDLEQFITDGYAGETIRQTMAPDFRRGDYSAGLVAGATRIIGRIAEARNVTLDGVKPPPQRVRRENGGSGVFVALFVVFIVINAIAGRVRRRRRWGRWGGGPWSGWSSGVGPFGGGGGGGFGGGGGGFGGGFGGFGGGRSGGGGASGGW